MTALFSVTQNDVLGVDGKLAHTHPADFAHFKLLTQGGVLIAGRKTAEEMPRVLLNRTLLVVTSSKLANRLCVPNLESAFDYCQNKPTFVIGGALILNQVIHQCTQCLITRWSHTEDATGSIPFDTYRTTHSLCWSWKTKHGFTLERWVRNGNKKGEMESKECGSIG